MKFKQINNGKLLFAISVLACASSAASAGENHVHAVNASSGSSLTASALTAPVMTKQLADEDFVYDVNKQSKRRQSQFDYVSRGLLSGKNKESFNHWVGFHSINPELVLSLIEMQSGAITNPSKKAMKQPFGDLSDKTTFSSQLDDVLSRLARHFYDVRRAQAEQNESKGYTAFARTAATESLTQLLQHGQGNGESQNRVGVLSKLSNLVAIHDNMFETPLNFGKEVFSDLSAASSAPEEIKARAVVGMQLPWSRGYSWKSNGSHGYDGSSWPHSSLDFSYDWPQWNASTWSVRAAHSGTVQVMSSCQVRVTNSSGWATTYYHLSNVNVYNGQQVNANTHLGKYASNKSQALCEGGSSTGPHLHFSLLRNGAYHSLNNVSLSNYVVKTGNSQYDNNCSSFYYNKNGSRVCAWTPMVSQ